jgi:HEAT repeat protein
MLGKAAPEAKAPLAEHLQDASPLVRIAAAEGVYQLGDASSAIDVLTQALEHDTPFVRLRALNVLYRMGVNARPALPAVKQASMEGIFPAEYANRLIKYLPDQVNR